jgi:caffeoyl-CoA O-methyltransferase
MNDQVRQQLNQYVGDLFAAEDEALRWIQENARQNGLPDISIEAFEGRLLQFLVYVTGAKAVVEIGTLAGYSAVWIARALPEDGKLYTLEKSSKHAQVARAGFERAGVSGKIELLEGSAMELLRKLGSQAPFDLVFIDADKASYIGYGTWAVEHLRPGGLVAAHNAFRGGRILAPESDDDRAMKQFNAWLAEHPQLHSYILPIGDGMAVGVKR